PSDQGREKGGRMKDRHSKQEPSEVTLTVLPWGESRSQPLSLSLQKIFYEKLEGLKRVAVKQKGGPARRPALPTVKGGALALEGGVRKVLPVMEGEVNPLARSPRGESGRP